MGRLLVAGLLSAFLIGAGAVPAVLAESHGDMAAQVTAAKTAADHEAIAASYTKMAENTKAEIAMHEKMLAGYRKSLTDKVLNTFENHCNTIIALLQKQANEYEAMAAAHRELAKKS